MLKEEYMFQFIFHDINLPYTIALTFILLLALLEGVFLLIGASVMEALDKVIPIDFDADIDLNTEASGIVKLLGWLNIDKLPLLVWLVLLFTSFATSGYLVTYNVHNLFNFAVPFWLSSPVALIGMGLITHHLGLYISKIAPKEESSAINVDDFVGALATITLGSAKKSNPAEAMFKDKFNQKHYVMVEPESEGIEFTQGTKVTLIEKGTHSWLAQKQL